MMAAASAFLEGWQVMAGVAAILGTGVVLRRRLSLDSTDRAKNEAEKSIFTTHVGELRLDRDRWEASATEAWALVRDREVENAVLKLEIKQIRAQIKLQNRLTRLYPDLAREFISGPGDLDSRPLVEVVPLIPKPGEDGGG